MDIFLLRPGSVDTEISQRWKAGQTIFAEQNLPQNYIGQKFGGSTGTCINILHHDALTLFFAKVFSIILKTRLGYSNFLKKTAAKGIVLSGWARYHSQPVFVVGKEESGDIRNSQKNHILIPSVAGIDALLSAYEFKNITILRPPEAPRFPDSGEAVWLEYYFEN